MVSYFWTHLSLLYVPKLCRLVCLFDICLTNWRLIVGPLVAISSLSCLSSPWYAVSPEPSQCVIYSISTPAPSPSCWTQPKTCRVQPPTHGAVWLKCHAAFFTYYSCRVAMGGSGTDSTDSHLFEAKAVDTLLRPNCPLFYCCQAEKCQKSHVNTARSPGPQRR